MPCEEQMGKNPEITSVVSQQQLCAALRRGTNPPPAIVKKSSLGELGSLLMFTTNRKAWGGNKRINLSVGLHLQSAYHSSILQARLSEFLF